MSDPSSQDNFSDRSTHGGGGDRSRSDSFHSSNLSQHSRGDITSNLDVRLFSSSHSAGSSSHPPSRFGFLDLDPSSDYYNLNRSQLSSQNLDTSQRGGSAYSQLSSLSDSSLTSQQPLTGTTVVPNKVVGKINHFLHTFRLPVKLPDGTMAIDSESEPFYRRELLALLLGQKTILNVNIDHLTGPLYQDELGTNVIFFPSEMLILFDHVVNHFASELRTTAIDQLRALYDQQQQLLQDGQGDPTNPDPLVLIEPNDQSFLQYAGFHSNYINVRFYSKTILTSMRSLNPSDIETLVCIRGMVLRLSSITPELKSGYFECTNPGCSSALMVQVSSGVIKEPSQCPGCQKKNTMELQHNRSIYASKQVIKLQETPEDMANGETPQTISVWVYDDLVDSVKAGDRVVITGIYKAQPLRVNPDKRTVKDKLYTYIDALHFRMVSAGSKSSDDVDGATRDVGLGLVNKDEMMDFISEEQEEAFHRLAQHPAIYDILTNSLAPSVWGNDDVKKGLLCLMFGGSNIDGISNPLTDTSAPNDGTGEGGFDPNITGGSKRGRQGTIHVLLVGDPGTAKSQLLQYVHKISSRGVYTSGTASSAAGLTASVTRDPIQGEMVLESGALVISDGGVCCIDEFDKMNEGAQSILHEAMEQQTVSIAKAGVICTLSARTSILASANPTDSRYNPNRSIVQNINLSPSLLSRFDLIYIMLDVPDRNQDYRLAEHLLTMFMNEEDREEFKSNSNQQKRSTMQQLSQSTTDQSLSQQQQEISGTQSLFDGTQITENTILLTKELMDYINYARSSINPVLSEEAIEELEHSYLKFRGVEDANQGGMNSSSSSAVGGGQVNSFNTTISATTRQLHSLIKISEALARMQLKDNVTRAHVQEATRLILSATLASAIDPNTGLIDMGSITTGISSADRDHLAMLKEGIRQILLSDRSNIVSFNTLLGQLQQQLDQSANPQTFLAQVQKALSELHTEQMIDYNIGGQYIRIKQRV